MKNISIIKIYFWETNIIILEDSQNLVEIVLSEVHLTVVDKHENVPAENPSDK